MKHTHRSRAADEEDAAAMERLAGSSTNNINKDCSFRLVKVVSILVIFVSGVVFGLLVSANVTGFFSTSRNDLYFPSHHYHDNLRPSVPPIPSPSDTNTSGITINTTTTNYVKEDWFNFTRFLHPTNLTHTMTDEQLFWRASMVPQKQDFPFKRVPKVAFMFLTRGPLPLFPLWDKFFKGHEGFFSVYVHAPPGYKLNVSETSAFYNRQIPSQSVKWGSIELADGERRLLSNALLDFSNERFVLLSESCIPVYNFETVYDYLVRCAHSFVESYDDPSRYGRGRYSRKMLPDIRLHQWRKGSEWFELKRGLAVSIVSDTKYYTLFKKYCKPSCYPDEHYLPTYLNMFFPEGNSNRSVTWVDWSRGGPHPAMFGEEDISEVFVESIRNNGSTCLYNLEETDVCYLFARKFGPSALEPLLNLSSTVMKF